MAVLTIFVYRATPVTSTYYSRNLPPLTEIWAPLGMMHSQCCGDMRMCFNWIIGRWQGQNTKFTEISSIRQDARMTRHAMHAPATRTHHPQQAPAFRASTTTKQPVD